MHLIDLLIAAAYGGGPILLGTICGTCLHLRSIRREPDDRHLRSIRREPDDLCDLSVASRRQADDRSEPPTYRGERGYTAIRQIPATIRHYRRPPAFRPPTIRTYSTIRLPR